MITFKTSHSSILPSPKDSDDIVRKYEGFFKKRDEDKVSLYKKVTFCGWCASAIGAVFIIVGIALEYLTAYRSTPYFIGTIIVPIASFISVFGICIISTIPTDEFDIDSKLEVNPRNFRIISIIYGTFVVFIGIFFTNTVPYVTGIVFILIGLSAIFHRLEVLFVRNLIHPIFLDWKFSSKMFAAGLLAFPPIACFYFSMAFDPVYFTASQLFVPNNGREYYKYLESIQPISILIYLPLALNYVFCMLFCIKKYYDLYNIHRGFHNQTAELDEDTYERKNGIKGWRTSTVYYTLYAWMYGICFQLFLLPIISWITPYLVVDKEHIVPYISVSITISIPILLMLMIGPKKWFSLLARYFEYDIKLLQKDGAFMASLVKSCEVLDLNGKVYWIHRHCAGDDKIFSVRQNCVDRNMWMKGVLVERPNESNGYQLIVEVLQEDDCDLTWQALYEGDTLTVDQAIDVGGGGGVSKLFIEPTEWVARNFQNSVMDKGRVKWTNQVSQTLKEIDDETVASNMLTWAKNNLKRFDWKNFNDDLLKFSPRQLVNDELKKAVFELSDNIYNIDKESDKIDFFISHSWVGEPTMKCKALREVAEAFIKRNGRNPTFWFDKVCINQKDPSNYLEVLPINIGACKKMLILMDRTYIERIWCIWEFFTLLTFCNKELALERVEIKLIPSHKDEDPETTFNELFAKMKSFNFDNAHCYDPNEEFKLRKIISNVGIKRLGGCMESLAEILKKKWPDNRHNCFTDFI